MGHDHLLSQSAAAGLEEKGDGFEEAGPGEEERLLLLLLWRLLFSRKMSWLAAEGGTASLLE